MQISPVRILLAACPLEFRSMVEAVPALPSLACEFTTADSIPADANFDLIIAGPELRSFDWENLPRRAYATQIILLLEDASHLPANAARIADIWKLPMSGEEVSFHFSRWQQRFQTRLDLEMNRHFLHRVLDASPNLIWFKDKEGRHQLVNASFCQTVGKSHQQIQGQKHAYIWDVEQDDPACIESERIVMETGHTHVSEETIKTGDGTRLLTTYKTPLWDRSGEIWGTMGIAVDITREREFQTRLIQNNATLETIFTTMDCGILCHTLDGNQIISVNKAALALLGYQKEEDLQNGFRVLADSVFESDKDRLRGEIGKLHSVGDSANYEYRILLPDGQIRYVLGNAKVIEKDGKLICQRLLLDWTRQKLAEEQAKSEQEKHYRELMRALSVDYQLVWVIDPKSRDVNILQLMDYPDPDLKKIFEEGTNFNKALETYIDTCVFAEDRKALRTALSYPELKRKLKEMKTYYFNFRVNKDDGPHYFQLKAVRAGTAENPLGLVIGLESINKRIQQELEQKATLAQALKEARKASDAKTRFLSNMSHDIRTPMNAVVGYTTLALNQPENSPTVQNYLEKILAAGKHLLSLINDILDMSHIESGKLQLDEQNCSLTQILEELINIVQPTSNEKNLNLELDVSGLKHPWIYCDRLRLNQVLLNLLSNSVKYTPANGRVKMTVSELTGEEKPVTSSRGAGEPDDVRFYEFHIQDNGIGMSEEFLARLFEPFERAQTSTIAGIQGTGLGMPIAKNIVDMMHGEIKVKSELDKGTEFRLIVPFRSGEATSGSGDAPLYPKGKRLENEAVVRILLAEDNEMNQEIAREFLTDAGYEVDIASNGQEAIELLSEKGEDYYSLILMDVQMPVMDGYKATEMIRSLPDRELARIPIIALTANSFEEDRQEALARGMSGHIAKPINFDLLFSQLDLILGGGA